MNQCPDCGGELVTTAKTRTDDWQVSEMTCKDCGTDYRMSVYCPSIATRWEMLKAQGAIK